jgi:uncharacterized protein
MAGRLSTQVFFHLPRQIRPTTVALRQCPAHPPNWIPRHVYRTYSSDAAPPLLSKLKSDLKTAMKAKDAPRLAVLRAILAATLNASKTAVPITTDAQLVALLHKTARSSQDAIEEFRNAGRQDLVEKEEAQMHVLEEYAAGSGVQSLDDAGLRAVVQPVIAATLAEGIDAKSAMGKVMKGLVAPGGPLDGKHYEKAKLSEIVKEILSTQ